MTRSRLKLFFVCLAGLVMSHADQSLFGYAIPGIRAEFDLSLEMIGAILAVSFIIAACFSVLTGVLADRFGRRVVFVTCLALSSLLVTMHYWVQGLVSLAILRTLSFSVAAPLGPIGTTYLAEAAAAPTRALVIGFLQCAYPLGWFIASWFSAPLIAQFGWRASFLPAGLIMMVALLFARLLPESALFDSHETKAIGTSMRVLLSSTYRKRTFLCCAHFLFHGGAYAGTAFYFPSYFQEAHGYSPADATSLVGLAYGIGVFGYLFAAVVGQYWLSRRQTIMTWLIAGTTFLVALLWLANDRAGYVLSFGGVAVFLYGVAAVQWTFVAEIFPTEARATATTTMLAGALAGFSIYPILTAWAVDHFGWAVGITAVVLPSLVLAWVCIFAVDDTRTELMIDPLPDLRSTQ